MVHWYKTCIIKVWRLRASSTLLHSLLIALLALIEVSGKVVVLVPLCHGSYLASTTSICSWVARSHSLTWGLRSLYHVISDLVDISRMHILCWFPLISRFLPTCTLVTCCGFVYTWLWLHQSSTLFRILSYCNTLVCLSDYSLVLSWYTRLCTWDNRGLECLLVYLFLPCSLLFSRSLLSRCYLRCPHIQMELSICRCHGSFRECLVPLDLLSIVSLHRLLSTWLADIAQPWLPWLLYYLLVSATLISWRNINLHQLPLWIILLSIDKW